MGLSELEVRGYRCGGTQASTTCRECSDIRTCSRCINPLYSILNELCVVECPPKYYTYTYMADYGQASICYSLCLQNTYPLDLPASKTCQQCPASCTACSSPSVCFSCAQGYFLVQA